MFPRCRLLLACAALVALPSLSHAQSPKPPIRGLISMGAYKFVGAGGDPVNTLTPIEKKRGIFSGIVIVATWAQLQPTPGAQITDGNVIDQALDKVRGYNTRNPQNPIAVKLRIWGGWAAPDWAKSIGGGAPINTMHNNKPRTVGRFWSPPYRKAWAALQTQLAERYDNHPLIREVAITSCMSYTAEPFFLPVNEPLVMNPLIANGYTAAAYRFCLSNAINDHAAWKRARLVFPFNPLRAEPTQTPGMGDPAFTEQVMLACRDAIGVRCVFDNHDLDNNLAKPLLPIYGYMKELGPEIEFQTACASPAQLIDTVRFGAYYGATGIELYQDYGGFPYVSNTVLKRLAALLEGNSPPTSVKPPGPTAPCPKPATQLP
jgi:hypothetical protein